MILYLWISNVAILRLLKEIIKRYELGHSIVNDSSCRILAFILIYDVFLPNYFYTNAIYIILYVECVGAPQGLCRSRHARNTIIYRRRLVLQARPVSFLLGTSIAHLYSYFSIGVLFDPKND